MVSLIQEEPVVAGKIRCCGTGHYRGTLLRLALTPLIGESGRPFITFWPAVLIASWYGGFRAAALCILLSEATAAYLFEPPVRSWWVLDPVDQIDLLLFLVVGFGVAFLSETQRRAVDRADREASLRRRAEQEERSARQRLETTLASIGDGVIATDAAGRVGFMNVVAERLTGWKGKEAMGQPVETVFQVVHEDTREPVWSPALSAMQEGRSVVLSDRAILLTKNGREMPVDDSGAPIRDSDGQIAGTVLTFRDITERRRVEKERETSTRTAQQLAAIVESSDDAILSKDMDLRITSWNSAAERMFGYTASEAIGQSVTIIIPEGRWSEEELVMRSIQHGEKVERHETERRCKDGIVIPVSLTVSPVHDSAGAVVGASTIVRDIRRQRAAEQEKHARLAAEEASRAKDEFLAMVSHDLRNPLSAITGWVVMLKQGQVPVERIPHVLGIIEKNARVESQLVESLLDLSRLAAGKMHLNMEGIDLSSLVEVVVDSLRLAADNKGVKLNVTRVDGSLTVVGDSVRLQQIFSNLVTNALKFTPRGGHVRIRLARIESQAEVQIVDDGDGIQPDLLPHIFERFRQEKSGRRGGLGLGLAIVRELAQAHGATVTAESRGKGQGSTFTVTIPITAVLPETVPMARVDTDKEGPVISGVRILIVDDETDARELVTLTLTSRGAVIHQASSVEEALDSLRREKFDLVISDIGMPHEDGYVLIQSIRAAERNQARPRLPAIALTSFASAPDRDRALAAGYDIHLVKPVAPADLTRAIDKVSRARDFQADMATRD